MEQKSPLNPTRSTTFVSNLWLAVAYFLVASATLLLTRFGGGMAYIWLATALLIARLSSTSPRDWAAPVGMCGLANFAASSIFGAGPSVAPLFAVADISQAVVSAFLLRRYLPDARYFDSPRRLSRFILIVGGVSPLGPTFLGAAVVHSSFSSPFWAAWLNFFSVHSLGAVIFLPLITLVARSDTRRGLSALKSAHHVTNVGLLLAATATDIAVFAQADLPLLFLPMLPLSVLAVRLGRLGAAVGVVLLAIVGTGFSASGAGPIALIHGSVGNRALFLQFYFAVAFAMVLPIAAELNRRKWLTRRLQDSEAMFRLMVDRSGDTIFNVAVDGRIRYVSPSVALLGITEELVGSFANELIVREDRRAMHEAHRQAMDNPHDIVCSEYRLRGKDGTLTWIESNSRAIVDSSGQVTGVVSAVRDVSARKAALLRLECAANTDTLTGLHNRRFFDERVEEAIQCARSASAPACLAVVDIDFFKQVNDRHGHPAGDEVLQRVSEMFTKKLRATDTVARIGGEEFGIILRDLRPDEAAEFCDRIRAAVADVAIPVFGKVVRVTVSIGIVEIAGNTSAAALLIAADGALYRAKSEGRNCLRRAA